VLISITASLPQKLWPVDRWVRLVRDVRESGVTIGLVGAKPKHQGRYWQGADSEDQVIEAGAEDLRGLLTLPQVVGALAQANLVVTIDNGITHLACATDTPVVGLFRNGIHRLWAPPVSNLHVIEPGPGSQVREIPYDVVWRGLEDLLKQ
jgi:ADP-heptose:LPS heptosyltransferase